MDEANKTAIWTIVFSVIVVGIIVVAFFYYYGGDIPTPTPELEREALLNAETTTARETTSPSGAVRRVSPTTATGVPTMTTKEAEALNKATTATSEGAATISNAEREALINATTAHPSSQ